MKINNITVQAPLKENFKIELVEIGIKIRMASGKMVKEIKALKNNYSLTYTGLLYSDYKTFLDVYTNGTAVSFTYLDNDIEQTKTVFVTSIPRGIYQEKSNISHSVTIILEEE